MIHYFRKPQYKLFGVKLIYLICNVILFFISFLLFRYGSLLNMDPNGFRYNYLATFLYGILLLFFIKTYHGFFIGYNRVRELVFAQFLSQLITIILMYLIVSIAWYHFENPLIFICMLGVQIVIDVTWTVFCNGLFYKLTGKHKALLIYRNEIDKKRIGNMHGKPIERIYERVDEIQYDGTFTELKDKLEGYDTIFVAGLNSRCRNGLLKYCKEADVRGFFLPHIGDTIMQDAKHVQSFDTPVLYVERKKPSPELAFTKRVFDIISSGISLIILSPLILIIAIAIKLCDGGPVFYRQTRLTRDEKEFEILKFRSMRIDAEKDGVARLSSGDNDDRVTPVGRYIRKYRLDEIPQLWNILKGDMSVVGPRPERPEIAEIYYKKMPEFRLRLQVKAGLTGYAQVYGKYNTEPYEKLEFDLLYINHMSVLTDLQLCFATLMTMFKKDSTEGVTGITAADDEEVEISSELYENAENLQ